MKTVARKQERTASVDALLNATAELLSETNAIDVSLSEISKRANINSAMIKYYFGNKEGLLMALLGRDAVIPMESLQNLIRMDLSADKKLTLHIKGIINAYSRTPYLNRLLHYMVESDRPESSKRVYNVFIAPMIEAYRAMVRQGVDEGILRDTDPRLLYYSLVGAADHIFHAGYSVRATLDVDGLNDTIRQQYIELVTGIFLRGLAP